LKKVTGIFKNHGQRFATFKLALFLGIVAFLAYANSIKNGFTVDDSPAIVNNTYVNRGVSAIPDILTTPYRKGFGNFPNDLYRPLSLVMFAVEYQLFNKQPQPMHLINILSFAGCVVLLFLFLDRFFDHKRTVVAFIAALLFALHPIHTEVVNNIKSRDELLSFFFAFACLIELMKYIASGKVLQLVGGAFCFLLSLLFKESVFTLVALIPLIFFFYKNEHTRRSTYVTLSIVLVAACALSIRYYILSYYHAGDFSPTGILDNLPATPGIFSVSRAATLILLLGYYVKLLFIPHPLIWDYGYNTIPPAGFSDPFVLLSLAVYIFLVLFSLGRLLQKRKDPFAFGILFFLVTILIFANILFPVGTPLAERFLFLPSVGFCLVAALLIEKLAAKGSLTVAAVLKQPTIFVTLTVLCLAYFVIVFNRNREWLNNYTLYSADVKKAPNARTNYLLGVELVLQIAGREEDTARRRQIWQQGIKYLETALSISPDYMGTENYLGYAYLHTGDYEKAEIHSERAMALEPDNTALMTNLAGIYFEKKEYDKAIRLFNILVNKKPADAVVYANLGMCYGSIGRYDSSIYNFKRSLAINPADRHIYALLAATYQFAGNADSAKKYDQVANSP
jgi:protein O-mannosyl-transferase